MHAKKENMPHIEYTDDYINHYVHALVKTLLGHNYYLSKNVIYKMQMNFRMA